MQAARRAENVNAWCRRLTATLMTTATIVLMVSAQDKPQFPPQLTKLMEEVQTAVKPLQEAARFSKARFDSNAQHEELARLANRLAVLMEQTEKFSPDKDLPDKPKKDWLATCRDSAQYARQLAEAAKKKDYSAYRLAFKRMDAACTRCHEIFR